MRDGCCKQEGVIAFKGLHPEACGVDVGSCPSQILIVTALHQGTVSHLEAETQAKRPTRSPPARAASVLLGSCHQAP